MNRTYELKKKVSAKQEKSPRKARRPKVSGAAAPSTIVPLMRCSMDPQACPASGSIVAIYSNDEKQECIVCGRFIRVRGQRSGAKFIGRVPTHRRADDEAKFKARLKNERLRCRFDQAEKTARDALARKAPARAARASTRAQLIAERLPANAKRKQRLERLETRVFAARTKARAARFAMPKDPRRLFRAIVDASGFDVSAVEPDGLIDHISAALPERIVASIARQPSTEWVRRGLEALLRWSKPKKWDDLERRGFAGDRSVMAFIREFPGLELLRLPDRAYDESASAEVIASEQFDEIPF